MKLNTFLKAFGIEADAYWAKSWSQKALNLAKKKDKTDKEKADLRKELDKADYTGRIVLKLGMTVDYGGKSVDRIAVSLSLSEEIGEPGSELTEEAIDKILDSPVNCFDDRVYITREGATFGTHIAPK